MKCRYAGGLRDIYVASPKASKLPRGSHLYRHQPGFGIAAFKGCLRGLRSGGWDFSAALRCDGTAAAAGWGNRLRGSSDYRSSSRLRFLSMMFSANLHDIRLAERISLDLIADRNLMPFCLWLLGAPYPSLDPGVRNSRRYSNSIYLGRGVCVSLICSQVNSRTVRK